MAQPTPWLSIQANSEQRQPVYLGVMPYDMPRPGEAGSVIRLPAEMKVLAEKSIRKLALSDGAFQVELWPAQNDIGRRTWALARWRKGQDSPWQWLEAEQREGDDQEVFLPSSYDPGKSKDDDLLFKDFLELGDLYLKPVYGDCVWTAKSSMTVYGAWLPLEQLDEIRAKAKRSHAICHRLPQPARLDGAPVSLVVSHDSGTFAWPAGIRWGMPAQAIEASPAHPKITSWAGDFEARYRSDVLTLDGESEYRPGMRFTRKNSADPRNELGLVADYLESRYASLGLHAQRKEFSWRGIKQVNLVAVLPGTAPDHASAPVLMADHYDTAFCEDVFADQRERVSAPGADDNASATAALLRAAETLASIPHKRDIWLVHLTGEEFPGDDLGARALVSRLLADGQRISGLVLMDMIGWHKSGDGVFQINAGDSEASRAIAGIALGAALELAPKPMIPVTRIRFDEHSYLFNTDGVVFSDSGLPVVLLNEHVNELENLNRDGYHQTTDTSPKMDFAFASTIAKIAIQTALSLANQSH